VETFDNKPTAAGQKTVDWRFAIAQQHSDDYIQEAKVERPD
jgi:hypothetical protein